MTFTQQCKRAMRIEKCYGVRFCQKELGHDGPHFYEVMEGDFYD